MLEYLGRHVTANAVRMLRPKESRAIAIFEGPTDAAFFGYYLAVERPQRVVAGGKEAAVGALEILHADQGFDSTAVVAIVDADFWIIEDAVPSVPGLFLTDGHDVEMMVTKSSALEKVVSFRGDEGRLESFERAQRVSVREVLLRASLPLGCLRLLSARINANLDFDRLDLGGKRIDADTCTPLVRELVVAVLSRSGWSLTDVDGICQALQDIIESNLDAWHVCNGHDLAGYLAILLGKAIGRSRMKAEEVETALREAYEQAHFRETALWADLARWDEANPGYRLLPEG